MLMLDRRMLLRAGSAAAAAAALAPTAPGLAHAPQAGKRAQPSFYRFKPGTIEITVVSDGTLAFPAETLWGDRADDARGLLTSTFQPSSPVGLQINTILVNTGDKLVLIDAGCGVDKFQKTAGGLVGNLAAAGYAPDLGAHQFRQRRNAPHRRRRGQLGGQLPTSGMAVRVRPGRATGNKGAHGFPRPRSGRQDAGRQLPSTLSWLRARTARGERLPLAAGGLAVDDLTTTPGGGGVPLKLQDGG